MLSIRLPFFLLTIVLAAGCITGKQTSGTDDGRFELTILQLNDVYEIAPLSNGRGGLARVAALERQLKSKDPNTITILAGDFISPSAIGTLKYEGSRIKGRQMVETLNSVGLDYVVFGNHEFDYDQEDLQRRLDESQFTWLSANAHLKTATGLQPFYKNNKNGGRDTCPARVIIPLRDADGTQLRLGLFGVLINTGKKDWVQYSNWNDAAKAQYNALAGQTDVVVAVTHLAADDDKSLARMLPQPVLYIGGHDHDNMRIPVGNTVITKADANAKTVYIHHISYNAKTKKASVRSELRVIDAAIPEEPVTAAIVTKWEKIRDEALKAMGMDAGRTVTVLKDELDCREVTVRFQQAPVGDLLTSAMLAAGKHQPEIALINSGSLRIDDLMKGTVSEYDVVRMLPFGGGIAEVEMRGSLLRRTLETGVTNKGNGGYLQYKGVQFNAGANRWEVKNAAIEDARTYKVILPEFLLTGNEQNMGFLKTAAAASGTGTTNPDITTLSLPDVKDNTDLRTDIRRALIAFWKKQ